jgi:hypothetical protein
MSTRSRPLVQALDPLEVLQRQAEWRLAVVLLSMIVLPGAAALYERDARIRMPEQKSCHSIVNRSGRDRRIRPPRSC